MKIKWSSGSIELDRLPTLQKRLRDQIAEMLCGMAREISELDSEISVPVTGVIKTEIDHWDARITLEIEWEDAKSN